MIALLSAATALAAPVAGGYRLGPAPTESFTAVRAAQVFNTSSDWVTQLTPRQRLVGERRGLEAELPIVATYAPDGSWGAAGFGMPRLALFWLSEDQSRRYAVEGCAPIGFAAPVSAWGSISRETLEGREVLFSVEEQLPGDRQTIVRFGAGLYGGPFVAFRDTYSVRPAVEAAVAQVIPLAGPWAVAWEAEALIDRTPLSLRVLPRLSLDDRIAVDAGVQIPVVAYLTGVGTVQLVSQVRWAY